MSGNKHTQNKKYSPHLHNNNTSPKHSNPITHPNNTAKSPQSPKMTPSNQPRENKFSKNKAIPANHLLNYTVNSKPSLSPSKPQSKLSPWVLKDRFLQANFQFIVSKEILHDQDSISVSDYLTKWQYIKQVIMLRSEEYACPICLEEPVAPKITKCGHIFCWTCLLHFFNATCCTEENKLRQSVHIVGDLEVDHTYKKCPFCSELFSLAEVKSTLIKKLRKYKEGDEVEMIMLKRNKQSVIAIPLPYWKQKYEFAFPKCCAVGENNGDGGGDEGDQEMISAFTRFRVDDEEENASAYFGYSNLEVDILRNEKSQLQHSLLITDDVNVKLFIELALLQIKLIEDRFVPKPNSFSSLKCDTKNKPLTTITIPSLSSSSNSEVDHDNSNSSINDNTNNNNNDNNNNNNDNENNDNRNDNTQNERSNMILGSIPLFVPSFMQNNNVNLNVQNNNNNNNNINNNNNKGGDIKNQNMKRDNNNKIEEMEDGYMYCYQEVKGVRMFLHPICRKALIIEHGNHLPSRINGKILQIEEITITDAIRKRYKFLEHLPLSTTCYFCELEMKSLISKKTMKAMGSIFIDRKKARQKLEQQRRLEKSKQENQMLFPKTIIDWDDSPALYIPNPRPQNNNFIDDNVDGDEAELVDQSSSSLSSVSAVAPKWVGKSDNIALQHVKTAAPITVDRDHIRRLYASANKQSGGFDSDSDNEEEKAPPDYRQSFIDAIPDLPVVTPTTTTGGRGKKKKNQKVVFFNTSQKRSYK